jgi:muconolactone delta-isomerase
MAKKQLYFNEAERLYVVEHCTLMEIASRLRLGEKTVRIWKDEGDWETKRLQHIKSKEAFHEELYEFARKLMRTIKEDMENGKKVDPGRMYAFIRLLPLITKVKDYEDVLSKKETEEGKKGLTEDVLKIMKAKY